MEALKLSDEELDRFVLIANKAVDLAGELVKKYFWNPELVQQFDKIDEDGCIVEKATNADVDAEDTIVSTIVSHFPSRLVFGEEGGWRIPANADSDFVWVVDPIDGTRSFKLGHPTFGTLVALLYKNKPIIGIIDQPIMPKRWVGVHGRSTTVNGSITHTHSSDELSLARAELSTSSPKQFEDVEYEAFERVADKVFEEPHYGAECLTYGSLASGQVDLIIQSYLKPYDFLAFIPVIEGAGGVITDWEGNQLHWEASPAAISPPYYKIIAAGDSKVHTEALELLYPSSH